MFRSISTTFFVITLGASLISCSSKKNDSAEEPTVQLPTNIPTSTQNYNDSNLNSDLFSTNTNSDLLPAGTSSASTITATVANTPAQTSSTQLCLNGTQTAYNSNDSLQSACYAPNAPNRSDLDLYNMGLGMYGSLDSCVNYVRAQLLNYCSSNGNTTAGSRQVSDQAQSMIAARMGLVRCFRRVLAEQNNFAQWQPEVKQNYNYNDGLMFLLLYLFSNK